MAYQGREHFNEKVWWALHMCARACVTRHCACGHVFVHTKFSTSTCIHGACPGQKQFRLSAYSKVLGQHKTGPGHRRAGGMSIKDTGSQLPLAKTGCSDRVVGVVFQRWAVVQNSSSLWASVSSFNLDCFADMNRSLLVFWRCLKWNDKGCKFASSAGEMHAREQGSHLNHTPLYALTARENADEKEGASTLSCSSCKWNLTYQWTNLEPFKRVSLGIGHYWSECLDCWC